MDLKQIDVNQLAARVKAYMRVLQADAPTNRGAARDILDAYRDMVKARDDMRNAAKLLIELLEDRDMDMRDSGRGDWL